MTDHNIPIAILGATGYAGEGTVKALLGHPHFNIVHAGSDRLGGTPLSEAVPELKGQTDLILQEDSPERILKSGARAVILCKKSPQVTEVVPELLQHGMKIIDIGAEFRLHSLSDYQKWHNGAHHACPDLLDQAVYGLSEIHTDAISKAQIVGNPGCYATSILMPLIPLLREQLIDLDQDISAIGFSGLSGAGKRFIEGNNNLFYAMDGNLHSYRAIGHQHNGEISQECQLAAGTACSVRFIPHLAPLVRGIHTTITATLNEGVIRSQAQECWDSAYAHRPFIRQRASCRDVEVGNVAHTNFNDLAIEADGQKIVITSAIDNLIKGASGQAVQNLNIMFGLPETTGLFQRAL